MLEWLEWYNWAVLGVVLLFLELFLPFFILIWFGLGALLMALLVWLMPAVGFSAQILTWIVISTIFLVFWFKVYKPLCKTKSGQSSAQAIGEVGLLVDPLEPFGKSRVRFQVPLLGTEIWECVSDDKIDAGDRVKVLSVDGNILKVTKEI
ncbi:MAG: NfeD family protein [Alphaproteobacteria bacterium]|nr:NfeD family protein [Alphaproteobacteria bacterium]MCL2505442.1 NfeD family protein [Alphaproteobacteria bacterium]